MVKILIVEDDSSFGLMLTKFLERNHFKPVFIKSSSEALFIYEKEPFDIVLTDLKLPDFDGITLLKKIKELNPRQTVVLMTSYGHVRTAVQAIKLGAFEYITKPIDHEELLSVLQEAARTQPRELKESKQPGDFNFISGESKVFKGILEQARLVAKTQLSVLILGESGTGKEYLARYIHQNSQRHHMPFVAIDCGALSKELAASELFGHTKGAFTGATQDKEGQFSVANGGTLFLDEIGNLGYDVQVQLLRTLQEREIRKVGSEKTKTVDVRVIAATNESLKEKAQEGAFREDLYHRINEFQIDIPPLRERKEDLEYFARHFIELSNSEFNKNLRGMTEQARERLLNYHWSGNIRELKNVIRRAVLLEKSDLLQATVFPDFLDDEPHAPEPETTDLKRMKQHNEIETIKKTLKKTRYNKSEAARILNIDRTTLYEKIRKYNLQ